MRIKSHWFKAGAAKSATDIAGAAAFIVFRIAQNALKNMRDASYELPPGAPYFAFLAEFLAFLTLCADRIAYARGDEAWRVEFTTAMANKVGEFLAGNESDLLGGRQHRRPTSSGSSSSSTSDRPTTPSSAGRTTGPSTVSSAASAIASRRRWRHTTRRGPCRRSSIARHPKRWRRCSGPWRDCSIRRRAGARAAKPGRVASRAMAALPKPPSPARLPGPFDVDDARAYRAWRDRKLAGYPGGLAELIVEVGDPRALTRAERDIVSIVAVGKHGRLCERHPRAGQGHSAPARRAVRPVAPRPQLACRRRRHQPGQGHRRAAAAATSFPTRTARFAGTPTATTTRRSAASARWCSIASRGRPPAARTRCSIPRSPTCSCATPTPSTCAR